MEGFFLSWATPKEVAIAWYVFVAVLLLVSIPLVIDRGFLRLIRAPLAGLLVVVSMMGFFFLTATDIGLAWPTLSIKGETSPEVLEGEKIFLKYGCPNCHQVGDFGTPAGPHLTGISQKMDAGALADYIAGGSSGDLHSIMPDYKQMTPEELRLLIKFLSRL